MKASSSNERETTKAKLHFRIGSSETTRESPLSSFETEKVSSYFNFDDFLHNHLPEHKTGVDIDFLEWFIGFVEGAGTFSSRLVDLTSAKKDTALLDNVTSWPITLSSLKRRRFLFQICQKDPKVLYKIRTALGFGKVYESGGELTRHWRYTIEDRRGLQRIMALFNGNLILPKRRRQFANWVKEAALIHHSSFALKQQEETSGGPVISLNTGWLSGLIDAEGCFYAHVTTRRGSKKFRLLQKMHITQTDVCGDKEILSRIGELLQSNAKVSEANKRNCYRIEVSSLTSHKILVDYLIRFPLHQKAVIGKRWWRVYQRRQKNDHLTETGIRRMHRLCASIRREKREEAEFKKLLKQKITDSLDNE
jgi:hypothetical protein